MQLLQNVLSLSSSVSSADPTSRLSLTQSKHKFIRGAEHWKYRYILNIQSLIAFIPLMAMNDIIDCEQRPPNADISCSETKALNAAKSHSPNDSPIFDFESQTIVIFLRNNIFLSIAFWFKNWNSDQNKNKEWIFKTLVHIWDKERWNLFHLLREMHFLYTIVSQGLRPFHQKFRWKHRKIE